MLLNPSEPVRAPAELETPRDHEPSPRAAHPAAHAGVFSALGTLGSALYAGAARARSQADPASLPARTPAAHWLARLEQVALASREAERASSEARSNASTNTTELGSPAVVDANVTAGRRAEQARLGAFLETAQAYLAAIVAGRTAERLPAAFAERAQRFGERLLSAASRLEDVLSRGRHGDAAPSAMVRSSARSIRSETAVFFDTLPDGNARLRAIGLTSLFDAADGVEQALTSSAEGSLGSSAESQLNSAAVALNGATFDASAMAPERTTQPEPENQSPRTQRSEARQEPGRWELTAPESGISLDLADIARALGVASVHRLRDVLREGLRTKERFVVWRRPNTLLSAELERLASDGLIETRTLAR